MPKKQTVFRANNTITKSLYLFSSIAVLLGVVLFINTVHRSPIFANATTHKPEPYTELYFSNPNALPAVVRVGQTVPVSFTVHNVEGSTVNYTYDIDISNLSKPGSVLTSQSVSIPNGVTISLSSKFTVPKPLGRREVSVDLINKNQAIHIWVQVRK